jgi:hypothetical protein
MLYVWVVYRRLQYRISYLCIVMMIRRKDLGRCCNDRRLEVLAAVREYMTDWFLHNFLTNDVVYMGPISVNTV